MIDSRYEIKFILNSPQFSQALKWLSFHTSAKEAYEPRTVNSIYFDDNHFSSVKDNLIGISKRSKYRLRWYGEFAQQHQDEINFEIKSRVNRTGHKTRKKISLNSNLNKLKFCELQAILKKQLVNNFNFDKALYPTLQVTYKRKYFEGSQGIRVTFDNDIKYYRTPLHSKLFSSKPIKYPLTIMEVKFHPEQLKTVSSSFRDFHLIPKRHSKYLVGISMLGNAIYL